MAAVQSNLTLQPLPRWFWLSAVAFSLVHVLIDFSIGLWGQSSSVLSVVQVANIVLIAAIYGWWGLSLAWASRDSKRGLISLFGVTLIWPFLTNGLFAVLTCIVCPDAFPYQDISHFGSLIFGGLALYALWKAIRAAHEPGGWGMAFVPLGLMIATYAVEAIMFSAR